MEEVTEELEELKIKKVEVPITPLLTAGNTQVGEDLEDSDDDGPIADFEGYSIHTPHQYSCIHPHTHQPSDSPHPPTLRLPTPTNPQTPHTHQPSDPPHPPTLRLPTPTNPQTPHTHQPSVPPHPPTLRPPTPTNPQTPHTHQPSDPPHPPTLRPPHTPLALRHPTHPHTVSNVLSQSSIFPADFKKDTIEEDDPVSTPHANHCLSSTVVIP